MERSIRSTRLEIMSNSSVLSSLLSSNDKVGKLRQRPLSFDAASSNLRAAARSLLNRPK